MRYQKAFLGVVLATVLAPVSQAVEITIYNQDLALVKKTEHKNLKEGINSVFFTETAERMNPYSVLVYGEGLSVLEQDYVHQDLSYANLLKAYEGKLVTTIKEAKNGETIIKEAVLVGVNGEQPILKFDYGVDAYFDGRVVFNKIPTSLEGASSLRTKIEADRDGGYDVNLAYLTGGFSWEANYVAKINDDKTLSFDGRAAINNQSGSAYKNAKINLVAGDVNVVSQVLNRPRLMMAKNMAPTMEVMAVASQDTALGAPTSLNGYHIYKMPYETNLENGEMKMLSFVNAPQVDYKREAVAHSPLYFGNTKNVFKDVKPEIVYTIKNEKDSGLGLPLPQGKISFYDMDVDGELQFVGENRVSNRAEGEELRFNLGKYFDVTVKGEIKNLQKLDEKKYKKNPQDMCLTVRESYIYDATYTISNSSKYVMPVVLKQNMPKGLEIIKEGVKGEMEGQEYSWRFDVEPNTEFVLEVSLRNDEVERRVCDSY